MAVEKSIQDKNKQSSRLVSRQHFGNSKHRILTMLDVEGHLHDSIQQEIQNIYLPYLEANIFKNLEMKKRQNGEV